MSPTHNFATPYNLSFRAEQAGFLFHSRCECRPAQSRNLGLIYTSTEGRSDNEVTRA